MPLAVDRYNELLRLYRDVYSALGERDGEPARLGEVLPELRRIAAQLAKQTCLSS